jgi:triacylglycerol lipase
MNETVVLLHGAGRTRNSMGKIARHLAKLGYQIVNIGYPSRRYPVQGLAEYIAYEIQTSGLTSTEKVHFVTHSLGGIIVRWYLRDNPLRNLGRVVMLAPPNKGIELADQLMDSWISKWIVGPVGEQLGTGETSLPLALGSVSYPVGVIAGNKSFNPIFSARIPGPDDGRIAVERTKIAGMTDFLVMPYCHSLIMFYRPVIEQVEYFLKVGDFQR